MLLLPAKQLPGQICLEFVLTEGLCQAWQGSRGRLNFLGEALKELMALPASEWNGIGEIVETLKNVPLCCGAESRNLRSFGQSVSVGR